MTGTGSQWEAWYLELRMVYFYAAVIFSCRIVGTCKWQEHRNRFMIRRLAVLFIHRTACTGYCLEFADAVGVSSCRIYITPG